jgi:hypothetical protein
MGKAFFSHQLWIVPFACLVWHSPGRGADVLTANFDTLQEGMAAEVFSDGGLTFSSLDYRSADVDPPGVFVVEWATQTLLPPFSSPNVLCPGGPAFGPYTGFARFGSAWIDFDGVGVAASLDVFTLLVAGSVDHTQNILSLEAWEGPNLVTSSSVSFTEGLIHRHLSLVSPASFDRLRLNASGPVDDGVLLLVFDNVTVTLVPEPTTASLSGLTVGIVGFVFLRRALQRRPEPPLN